METTGKILDVLNPNYSFNYAGGKVPSTYRCQRCGRTHVRLWREEGITVGIEYVYCANCLHSKFENIEKEINEGQRIGSFIPAIPTEENNFFIGFKHFSKDGLDWWKKLPL